MNLNPSSSILEQVLRGLAGNRQPGWNFPGNFLRLSFDEVEKERSRVSLLAGPHAVAADGQLELAALAVLADIGMAASLRREVGQARRMATVQMSLSFMADAGPPSGAAPADLVEACSTAEGATAETGARQLFTRTAIRHAGRLCCVGGAAFMPLGGAALAPMPMARRGEPGFEPPLLAEGELDPAEAGVLARTRRILAAGERNFLARFWDLVPQAGEQRAACTLENGLHSGNRVGHTQGGIVLALAGHTCRAAVGADWTLAGISGWYLSPGRGRTLRAEAAILHRGSSTAACRCEIRDEEGRLVMHAVSSHVSGPLSGDVSGHVTGQGR
ncbi:hypothetical protein CAL29_11905 [Bordetella genomosp. 10]|uniref:Thioesterase domain-containing protein n=1 Tax=Bordetella genomosp. 10 TaxID=1416804 RepID=A0A261SBT5_9BORD|nr:PaaI family thioesterase [Bordetella genomosp. 10]OZI34240.1 hypothetical protein CAL29_11905 [Bordetella genomosp. 10]